MLQQRLRYLILSGLAVAVIGAASSANATCRQVHELVAQGFSLGEIAAGLGAPIGAVQACLQPAVVAVPRQRVVASNPAGPAPFGAPGPPPLGAAGPPPLGAPGPPPLGAPGPAPIGAAATTSGMSIRTR